MVKKINEKEFNEIKSEKVQLVDFSATWCGPCQMLAPVLEAVSEEMQENVEFYNVDVDENPDLAERFGIASIPALVLMKNGEKVDMQVGFQPKDGIINFIKSQL